MPRFFGPEAAQSEKLRYLSQLFHDSKIEKYPNLDWLAASLFPWLIAPSDQFGICEYGSPADVKFRYFPHPYWCHEDEFTLVLAGYDLLNLISWYYTKPTTNSKSRDKRLRLHIQINQNDRFQYKDDRIKIQYYQYSIELLRYSTYTKVTQCKSLCNIEQLRTPLEYMEALRDTMWLNEAHWNTYGDSCQQLVPHIDIRYKILDNKEKNTSESTSEMFQEQKLAGASPADSLSSLPVKFKKKLTPGQIRAITRTRWEKIWVEILTETYKSPCLVNAKQSIGILNHLIDSKISEEEYRACILKLIEICKLTENEKQKIHWSLKLITHPELNNLHEAINPILKLVTSDRKQKEKIDTESIPRIIQYLDGQLTDREKDILTGSILFNPSPGNFILQSKEEIPSSKQSQVNQAFLIKIPNFNILQFRKEETHETTA